MGLTNNYNFLSNTDTSDSREQIIDKYKNHASVSCINKHMTNSELTFTFQSFTKNKSNKQLMKLCNDKKASQSTGIPTKLIKEFCDFFSEFIYTSINHCITEDNL